MYDATGRMTSVASGPTGISPTTYYSYNALGQRVFKAEPITGTHTSADPGFAYVYDEDGNLLREYGTGGASSTGSTEYIWLKTADEAKPVATVINGSLYMVTTDGLGTPRRLHNETGATYWQSRYNPFGEEAPTIGHYRFADLSLNPNPGTVSYAGSVTFNLRYPGQYYDAESGLNYNYFRSYDGKTGRYTQADPIGLDGGWNRFPYANQNPLSHKDPTGQYGIGGFLGGMTVNGGIQALLLHYLGEADWERAARCIDLNKVVISGALGLVGPTIVDGVLAKAAWSSVIAAQTIGISIKRTLPLKPFIPFGCEADCAETRRKIKEKLPSFLHSILENLGA